MLYGGDSLLQVMNMSNVWVDAVKTKMQQRQMTQRGLAQAISCHETLICLCFTGRQEVGLSIAQQIEKVLGVPLDLWYASRGRVPHDLTVKYSADQLVTWFERMREEP